MRALVGGIGYRWMRDGSFGLWVTDALTGEPWLESANVEIADLGYGALYAMQDLADRSPRLERLILVAGVARGRERGELYCRQWEASPESDTEVQRRVYESGAGVIDLDHLLVIANRFGALPDEVICLELEPVEFHGGDGLSAAGAECLPRACDMIRELLA